MADYQKGTTAGNERTITWEAGGYGSISVETNATTTSFAGASSDFSNKAQVTIFDTNGAADGATPDHTNDHITVTNTGVYLITASVSFSGGLSDTYSLAFFKNNGATQLGSRTTRKLGTVGDVGSCAVLALVSLDASDTVELWVQNEDDTHAATFTDVMMTVNRVN